MKNRYANRIGCIDNYMKGQQITAMRDEQKGLRPAWIIKIIREADDKQS